MKKTIKNKKLILIFLTLLLLLILLSTYIKITELELKAIFVQDDNEKEELLFETDKKIENKKIKQQHPLTENDNNSNQNQRTNLQEETGKEKPKIEKIALIKEIKDPFQADTESNNKAENSRDKSAGLEAEKVKSNQEIIFLERNIIAENILEQTQSREKLFQSEIEADKKTPPPDINSNSKDNKSTNKEQSLKSIRLPFQLVGIIKNSHNSSALFLYQGQTLLKTEKEKIDIFKIERINNKNLIISYQNEERRLHLWEEKTNEN